MRECECGATIKTAKAIRCHACANRVKAAARVIPINDAFFAARTVRAGECWIWTLGTTGGKVPYGLAGRGLAHRLAYEMRCGPVPAGREVSHLCGRSLCCNPDHLVAETHRENMLRAKHIWEQTQRTHCPYGHPYAGENLRVYRGKRSCRACAAIRRDENRARNKIARGNPADDSGDEMLRGSTKN